MRPFQLRGGHNRQQAEVWVVAAQRVGRSAGLDEGAKGSLTARMQEQTETAIALADAICRPDREGIKA